MFHNQTEYFFKFINKNFDFQYAVEGSIFFEDFDNNIEIIYDDTEFTIALISYLLSVDELNIKANMLVDFLGLTKNNIPEFDYKIAETLINGMLGKYENYFLISPLIISIVYLSTTKLSQNKCNKLSFIIFYTYFQVSCIDIKW